MSLLSRADFSQGGVTAVVHFPTYYPKRKIADSNIGAYAQLTRENCRVMRGHILFQVINGDSKCPVYSCFNGMPKTPTNKIRFAGIAMIEEPFTIDLPSPSGMTVQICGLVTVINHGTKVLKKGMKLAIKSPPTGPKLKQYMARLSTVNITDGAIRPVIEIISHKTFRRMISDELLDFFSEGDSKVEEKFKISAAKFWAQQADHEYVHATARKHATVDVMFALGALEKAGYKLCEEDGGVDRPVPLNDIANKLGLGTDLSKTDGKLISDIVKRQNYQSFKNLPNQPNYFVEDWHFSTDDVKSIGRNIDRIINNSFAAIWQMQDDLSRRVIGTVQSEESHPGKTVSVLI